MPLRAVLLTAGHDDGHQRVAQPLKAIQGSFAEGCGELCKFDA